jgi:hypothetical protein
MDVPTYVTLALSFIAVVCSVVSLFVSIGTRKKLTGLNAEPPDHKNQCYAAIASMLSDGGMVWQRLVVQCDELSGSVSTTLIPGTNRETIGDWLLQLRDFCKQSKYEIDHAYQLFAVEAKNMSSEEMEMQLPDMDKFNKEMRSNVAVISDQLEHISNILHGSDSKGTQQFKITLHKPQVMPHFLRKRQKIAELQRRRSPQSG